MGKKHGKRKHNKESKLKKQEVRKNCYIIL